MAELMRVTTYLREHEPGRGSVPAVAAVARRRPAVDRPDHTAMADFMDDQVGFVPRTYPEPTYWPHDPEKKTETYWNRMVWSDLRDHLLASADLVEDDPERYRGNGRDRPGRMAGYASREVVEEALREALAHLPRIETGRFAWASCNKGEFGSTVFRIEQ